MVARRDERNQTSGAEGVVSAPTPADGIFALTLEKAVDTLEFKLALLRQNLPKPYELQEVSLVTQVVALNEGPRYTAVAERTADLTFKFPYRGHEQVSHDQKYILQVKIGTATINLAIKLPVLDRKLAYKGLNLSPEDQVLLLPALDRALGRVDRGSGLWSDYTLQRISSRNHLVKWLIDQLNIWSLTPEKAQLATDPSK